MSGEVPNIAWLLQLACKQVPLPLRVVSLELRKLGDFFTPQGRPVRATGSGRLEVLEPVGNLEDLLELGSEGEIFDSFG